MPGHAGLGLVDKTAQALQRRQGCVQQPAVELAGKIPGVTLKYCLAKRFLAVEVMVERALGHPHPLEHGIDPRGHEALLGAATNQHLAGLQILPGDLRRTARLARSGGYRGHGDNIDRLATKYIRPKIWSRLNRRRRYTPPRCQARYRLRNPWQNDAARDAAQSRTRSGPRCRSRFAAWRHGPRRPGRNPPVPAASHSRVRAR